jgi:hypothetical protein
MEEEEQIYRYSDT